VGKHGVMKEENGLVYMRARYYHESLRRFVNRDTLIGKVGDFGSLNRFGYVEGLVVNGIDPSGHQCASAFAGSLSNGSQCSDDNFYNNASDSVSDSDNEVSDEEIINYVDNYYNHEVTKSLIRCDQGEKLQCFNVLLGRFAQVCAGITVTWNLKGISIAPKTVIKNAFKKKIKKKNGVYLIGSKEAEKLNSLLNRMDKRLDLKTYKELKKNTGVYVSKNGNLKIRIDENSITGKHGGGLHLHIEILSAKTGKSIVNRHIYYK